MAKPMTVQELKEKLDNAPDDYVVKIEPHYADVLGITIRDDKETIEIDQ